MSMLEYHRKIFDLIKASPNPLIDASFIEIDNTIIAIQQTEELSIEVEQIQGRLRLLPRSIVTNIYDSVDTFLLVKEISEDSNILIINDNYPVSYFDRTTFINFEQKENYLVTNHMTFLEFLTILKRYESETDEAFHFVDSYNKDIRKITFVSLTDKGRLNITYDLAAPLLDTTKNTYKSFEKFKACFDDENKSLLKFLKSATIATASNFPADQRLKMLIESLDDVVERARINFEVYLNNLSIDKIIKDYDEVKSKYFDSLSDILSKLSNKIITLPIGISATLFAIGEIKDSIFFLIFLLVAIIITSVYISLLLRIHFKDLKYISKIFHYDYDMLLGNNFFLKYPDEKTLFEEIKNQITDRISFLRIIIESYYWIMNITSLIICLFILHEVGVMVNGLVLMALGLALATVIFRNYVLDEDEKL